MKNVNELQTELALVWDKLKSGAIKSEEASAYARLAGGLVGASRVQLSYYSQRKEVPNIPFLTTPTNIPPVDTN